MLKRANKFKWNRETCKICTCQVGMVGLAIVTYIFSFYFLWFLLLKKFYRFGFAISPNTLCNYFVVLVWAKNASHYFSQWDSHPASLGSVR